MTETPLEKLIKKYGKTRYSVAKEIAQIKLEGSETEDYKEELKKKTKNYQSSFSRYESSGIKPKTEMLLCMCQAIGCDQQELGSVFYSKNHPCSEGCQTDSDNELLEQGYQFKCLQTSAVALYGVDNTVKWSKSYRIKSLIDNLKVLEELGFYECKRGAREVKIGYPEELFSIQRSQVFDSEENYITFILHKPLEKEENIEFSVNYSVKKLVDSDSVFDSDWIRCPTDLLRFDVTPPNPKKGQQAKLYEYENRNDYLLRGLRKDLGDLHLDESLSFQWEVKNPSLYHFYEICWG